MAAYSSVTNAVAAPVAYNPTGSTRVIRNVHDFSLRSIAQATSDTLDVIEVKAGDYVHCVHAKVITAEGETMVLNVGDTSGATVWSNGTLNANSAALQQLGVTGKLYTADNFIRVAVNTASGVCNVAKIEFVAVITKMF